MVELAPSKTHGSLAILAAAMLAALLGGTAARADEVRQVLPGGQAPAQPAGLTREKAPDVLLPFRLERFSSFDLANEMGATAASH